MESHFRQQLDQLFSREEKRREEYFIKPIMVPIAEQ
jgi:hypothetical protein